MIENTLIPDSIVHRLFSCNCPLIISTAFHHLWAFVESTWGSRILAHFPTLSVVDNFTFPLVREISPAIGSSQASHFDCVWMLKFVIFLTIWVFLPISWLNIRAIRPFVLTVGFCRVIKLVNPAPDLFHCLLFDWYWYFYPPYYEASQSRCSRWHHIDWMFKIRRDWSIFSSIQSVFLPTWKNYQSVN